MTSQMVHGSGTSSAGARKEKKAWGHSVDQRNTMSYGMSLSNKVNMTNCYNHCKHFFESCKNMGYESIHFNVLIAYWIMAGFLGPIDSVEEAYRKGHDLLLDLTYQKGILKPSDEDQGMVEFVVSTDSEPKPCGHEGFCLTENLGFVDLLDLGELLRVACTDGILKTVTVKTQEQPNYSRKQRKGSLLLMDGNHLSRQDLHFPSGINYLAYFNPLPLSLEPLLIDTVRLFVLLLRGCERLAESDFSFEKFKTLTVLEISGSTHLTTIPDGTISKMTQLRCLNLSDLLIESLPDDFFENLVELRWVILRGLSRLISLPTIRPLRKLQVFDLFQCTALKLLKSNVLPNPHLQLVDLSYTAMPGIPALRETKNLTHLFLRDSKVNVLNSLKQLTSLLVLDLSGAKRVTQVFQLKGNKSLVVLDLSRTSPESIDFLPDLTQLRKLILQQCSNLGELPAMKNLTSLEVLDISCCEKLENLPEDLSELRNLKELNLSECSHLKELREGLFDHMSCLLKLDLSRIKVSRLPSFAELTSLCKLFLRGLELDSLEFPASLSNLVELDLSGLKISSEFTFDFIQTLEKLEILNLSQTSVAKLPDMSKLMKLRELVLADCQQLKIVPDLQALTNLETLDLSLPDCPTISHCKAETEIEGQTGFYLSVPSCLQKLVLTNRSGMEQLFPPAKTDLSGALWDGTIHRPNGFHHVFSSTSTSDSSSGFHRFIDEFEKLSDLISNIQKNSKSTSLDTTGEYTVTNVAACDITATDSDKGNNVVNDVFDTVTTSGIPSETSKRNFRRMHTDLNYIRQNIVFLNRSHKFVSAEELLDGLMDIARHEKFLLDSTNLEEFLRIVVKLKLLIHPNQVDDLKEEDEVEDNKENNEEAEDKKNGDEDEEEDDETDEEEDEEEKQKKEREKKQQQEKEEEHEREKKKEQEKEEEKKKLRFRSKNTKTIAIERVKDPHPMEEKLTNPFDSYDSLSGNEKKCLLSFSVFPCSYFRDKKTRVLKLKSLVIKRRMLLHWWFGEEFIDNQHDLSSGDPTAETGTSIETGSARQDANQVPQQVSTTQGIVEKSCTIEEIGKEILKMLEGKRFIEPVMKKGRESGSYCMRPHVHSFVTKKAREEGFFDFDNKNGKLTPYFTRSRRACLLTSQGNSSSSYELWANYTHFPEKLESFENAHTLINVNESVIEINVEWFSMMKNLSVLHLGSWRSKNVDVIKVEGQNFLKELNKMEKLRLVSLRGLSPIMKLPDSVCKLTNLRILDLRGCSYLKKLPGDIGSLKNLTHLDITNCPLLSNLPKGISLLSQLEVLKGFRITDEGGFLKHRKMCILEDLLNLVNLSKLSLLVKNENLPAPKDVHVLQKMRNLRELKITWDSHDSFFFDDRSLHQEEQQVATTDQQEVPKGCIWMKQNCWVPWLGQNDRGDSTSMINQHQQSYLRKLVLRCFPHKTTSDLLVPSKWERLEELHVIGGGLKTFPGGTHSNDKWNVETLRLKFLRNLDISWPNLINRFPYMIYLEICECTKHIFPCDAEGVWRK